MTYPAGIIPPDRQSALIFITAQQLRQEYAPSVAERYAVVLELGKIFAWNLYGTDDHDGVTVIAPQSGGAGSGRWVAVRPDERGVDLADGDATIDVSGKRTRVLPAATLTDNTRLILDTDGALVGDELLIVRNDSGSYEYLITNGGAGAGNVALMPPSNRSWCLARFDGTDWIHWGSGIALATS